MSRAIARRILMAGLGLSVLLTWVGYASAQQCFPACNKTNVECLSGPEYENRRPVGLLSVGCTAFLIAEPNIVITNAHCNFGNPSTWSVTFNFECVGCESNNIKQPQTFGVQEVLLVDNPNDIMILRLNGNPAGIYGTVELDPEPVSAGTEIYEIHHAEGQPKGVDFGQVLNPSVAVPGCPGNIAEMAVSVIASQGASGSPVFRQDTTPSNIYLTFDICRLS